MKKMNKKLIIGSLVMGASLLVGAGIANVQNISAAADSSSFKVSEVSFRLPDETYGMGVRFLVEMSVDEYTQQDVANLTTGILVIPKAALTVNEELVIDSDNAYMENVKSVEWTVSERDSAMMETYVYVHSIPKSYYTSDIAVRAYIDDNDELTAPIYTSVASSSVAKAADWLYDNDTSLNADAKKNLRDNYLTYDVIYHDCGSIVEETKGIYNEIIPQPTEIVKKGLTFGGWWNKNGTAEWDFDTTKVGGVKTNLYAKWIADDVLDFSDDEMSTDMFVNYENQSVTLDTANDYVKIETNGAAWEANGGVVIDYGRTIPAGTNIAITYKVEAATNGTKFVMVQKNGAWEWDYNSVKVDEHSDFVTYAFSTAYDTNKIKLCVPDVDATYYIKKVEILSSLDNEAVTMLDFTNEATNEVTAATYLAQGGTIVSDATYGEVVSFKFNRNNALGISLNEGNGFVFSTPIVLNAGETLKIIYNSPVVKEFDVTMNGTKPTGVYSGYTAGTWSTFTYTAPAAGKTISTLGFGHWNSTVPEEIKIAAIIVNNQNNKAIDWVATETDSTITYKADFSTWSTLETCQDITYNGKNATIVKKDVNGTAQNVLSTGMNTSVIKNYMDFSALNLAGKKITFKMTMRLNEETNNSKSCDIYAGSSWLVGNYNASWMTGSWKTISETFTVPNNDAWSFYRQGGSDYAWDQKMYIASIEITTDKVISGPQAIKWDKTETDTAITYKVDFSKWNTLSTCTNITYDGNNATIVAMDVNGTTQNVLCTGINTSVMKTYFDFSGLDLAGKTITFKMTMRLNEETNNAKSCDLYVGSAWTAGNYNATWMTASWKTISETFTVSNNEAWSLYRQGGEGYAWNQKMYITSIEIIVQK